MLDEHPPSVPILSDHEVRLLLTELEVRWKKFRYAKNRAQSAREEADEVIVALYPQVPASRIGEITGLHRSSIWEIYHEGRTNGDA